MDINIQKNIMPHTVANKWIQTSFGRAFLVTLFFVTFASCLFWLDFFRSYNAEVTVAILPQSNVVQSSEVASTLKEITRTLSFYNRLIADNNFIDDDFDGYTSDVRKQKWQETVFVTHETGSGILVIHARGNTAEKAKNIASGTVKTLFSVASLYYDVKTDVDMRNIDGPIVTYTLDSVWIYLGVSIFSSVLLTSVFFFVLFLLSGQAGKNKKELFEKQSSLQDASLDEYHIRRAYPEFDATTDQDIFIDPKKFIPEKPFVLPFEETVWKEEFLESFLKEKTEENIQKEATSQEETVPVSQNINERNLPVADEDSLPFTFETVAEEEEKTETVISHEEVSKDESVLPEQETKAETFEPSEPTQEEYRRRLNALLAHIEK